MRKIGPHQRNAVAVLASAGWKTHPIALAIGLDPSTVRRIRADQRRGIEQWDARAAAEDYARARAEFRDLVAS